MHPTTAIDTGGITSAALLIDAIRSLLRKAVLVQAVLQKRLDEPAMDNAALGHL